MAELTTESLHSRESPAALRNERTHQLFARIEKTRSAPRRAELRREIAELNIGVVRSLARRYRGRGESLDDLEQAGFVGLMKAVNGFRPERSSEFLTYARPTITGELKKHFRDHCWTVRPTRRMQELQSQLSSVSATLSQELGHEPSLRELAGVVDADEDTIRAARAAHGCYAPRSLDEPLASGESAAFAAVLGEDDVGYAQAEAHVLLAEAVRRLSPRERQILGMRFFRDLTQRQIAAEIGTTQMQVSRVLTRIMSRLRDEIAYVSSR